MKGFGKLFLILGLMAVAFVVYAQACDTLFSKSAIADHADGIEQSAKRIEKTAKESEDSSKKGVQEDKKDEPTVNLDTNILDKNQTNIQYKNEEVSNNDTDEVIPGLLKPSEDNPKVRAPKRKGKRENPFKDVVLQTTSAEIDNNESSNLESQIKSDDHLRKSSGDKAPSKSNSKVLKTSTPKSKQQIPSGKGASIDSN